jgi:cobalt-zinc-cadmium efflux system protein
VLGAVSVLIVAILLLFTDWYILDPILSIMITLLILYNVFRSLKTSLRVFLQAVPENIDIYEIEAALMKLDDVIDIHHTHIWSLDGERHVLTTHVVVSDETDLAKITSLKDEVRNTASNAGLWHTTVEVDRESDDCTRRDCE